METPPTPPDELAPFLLRCGLPATRIDPFLAAMGRLALELEAENKRTNLSRITDPRDFWLLHVADSLAAGMVLPGLLDRAQRVADVGCGAGFPLLPLACANPLLELVGIEARPKKVAFVRAMADALGCDRCSAVAKQAREAGRMADFAGRFDLVLLRAVGSPANFVRECRQLLSDAPGSRIVFYKTPQRAAEEDAGARREAEKFGLRLVQSPEIALPLEAGSRVFVSLVRA